MDKEKNEIMSEMAIGSTFEISLRIILMLNALSPAKLDELQIGIIDFIAVYAADFGLLDENLHGYSNYRYGEFPARKQLIAAALKNLILDGYVQLYPTSAGYLYSILDAGRNVCNKLTSRYANEYLLAVQSVIDKFDKVNSSAMLKEINRLTIQSLQEVRHE